MKLVKTILIGVAATLLLSACGSSYTTRPISSGVIATDGVVIRAEDGTFEWRSGETFVPSASIQSESTFSEEVLPQMTSIMSNRCSTNPLNKCIPVRIKLPGYANEFYGVLMLSQAWSTSSGPGTRSYYIQIPDNYIQQATEGRMSVVYELVDNTEHGSITSWVLWFSDMPLR